MAGYILQFVLSSLYCSDRYFRNMHFWLYSFFISTYLVFVSYFVALQVSREYSLILFSGEQEGGRFVGLSAIYICCALTFASGIHSTPKFRRAGIQLPTIRIGGVHVVFVTANILRALAIYSILAVFTLITLDLGALSENVEEGLWRETADYSSRFAMSFSFLPIVAAYSLAQVVSIIARMTFGNLINYTPENLRTKEIQADMVSKSRHPKI